MSLSIDIDKVEEVLLADGWHKVVDHSFSLDAYEYVWKDLEDPVYTSNYGRECTGFRFKETVVSTDYNCCFKTFWTMGPMESLLAVREASRK